jgi:glycosyltransferase involved in cell wall biosynthesis
LCITALRSALRRGIEGQLNRVLMIAYHFPPLAGSSGIQRTLRFVQHLPDFGWQPLVLTAHPRAYERTSEDLLADVPPETVVCRAFALDTARHLSIAGRYLGALARPDRWMTWRFDAIRQGLRMIERYKPVAIWSTYPIATAHQVGLSLHQRTGLPWVADFRDPMAQDGYPPDPKAWHAFKRLEEAVVNRAQASVFTTPGAARTYRERYPSAAHRISVLENGYDEESFASAEQGADDRSPLQPGCVTLLHSGIVYPSERDPTHLMQALQQMVHDNVLRPGQLKVRFRASAHDSLLNLLAAQHGVAAFVETLPPVAYRESLAEMLRADALLVMQAANCNDQIPAKVYEYLRSRRPIVALTDPDGDTASVLRASGIRAIARLDDATEISRLLTGLLDGSLHDLLPTPEAVESASRRGRTLALANQLGALV